MALVAFSDRFIIMFKSLFQNTNQEFDSLELSELIRWQKPNRAQYFHFFSQITYILILKYYIGAAKYWDWYIVLFFFTYFINSLFFLISTRSQKVLFNITPLLILNSVFIFITGYQLRTYFIALLISLLVKNFFRFKKSPIYNPSSFAIMCMIVIGEGVYSNPVINTADRQWWIPVIFFLGIITTTISNRFLASLSYLFGLTALLLISHFAGIKYIALHLGTLLSMNSLLFTFHVLTDPKTTPNKNKQLLLFGLSLALVDYILRSQFIIHSNLIALNFVTALFVFNKLCDDKKFYHAIFYLILPFFIVIFGIKLAYFPAPNIDAAKYNSYGPITKPTNLKFHYANKTEKLHIVRTPIKFQNKNYPPIFEGVLNFLPAPIFAVEDLDHDGYQDIIISGTRVPFGIYYNKFGKEYEKDISIYNIVNEKNYKIVYATVFDFDNDGWGDIFFVTDNIKAPFHMLKNTKGHFNEITKEVKLDQISNPGTISSVQLLDFNRDGYLDLLISNMPIMESIPSNVYGLKNAKFSEEPNSNILILNNHAQSFVNATKSLGLAQNEFTHAIGIVDINNDFYPDLYVTDDYARDKVFINKGGKKVENKTFEYLGHIFNRNGMGSDTIDINHDGIPDIYTANVSRGNYNHGMNYFWVSHNGTYIDESEKYNISRCGYSWSPKFFDPDLDGNLDIIVGAGLKDGKDNIWYYANLWSMMPNFLKKHHFFLNMYPEDYEYYGKQRKCFFLNQDDKTFIDIGPYSGITDVYASRIITLVDGNNSGVPSILTGNFFSPRIQYYENQIPPENNWVGLKLVGTKSNRDAIGAKISYSFRNKTVYRDVAPTSGIGALHDKRIIIGLRKEPVIPEITVQWPSGVVQTVNNLKMNQYNTIIEAN